MTNLAANPRPALDAAMGASWRIGCHWRRASEAGRSVLMRFRLLLLFAAVLGCSSTPHYEPRLNGTWRLDHSGITNWVLGDLTLTFSNGWDRISAGDGTGPFRPYRVIERGTNFAVIEHLFGPHARVRFDFGTTGQALWIPQSTGSRLRFARVTEPDGSVDGGQPSSAGANRTSGAAAPHR
jgi:hypothetical protein